MGENQELMSHLHLYMLVINSKYIYIYRICFYRLGSARAVNRRYISDCVPTKLRMKASAGFVSASALGMACGPALAALLQTNFKIFHITFNEDTLPGWIMALAWLMYLVWLWFSFKEPYNDEKLNSTWKNSNHGTWTIFGFSVIQSYSIKKKKCYLIFTLHCRIKK